jgi:hypothetical protein
MPKSRTAVSPPFLTQARRVKTRSRTAISPANISVGSDPSPKASMPYAPPSIEPVVRAVANTGDKSWSLTPELLYTGIANLDLRLRATWLHGAANGEFGEKQNARRLELMARYYF